MKTLIIGFSTPNPDKLFSKLIRWIERSSFSHVYIKYYLDDIDRDIIYQASGLVVNFENIDLFYSKETIIKEFELIVTDDTLIKIEQFAFDNVGIPYSMKDILGLYLMIMLAKVNIKINNPVRDGKQGYVCSKLAAHIISEILGYKLEKDVDSYTPKDIYEYLLNNEKNNV